jgi:hypothetical protein
MTTFNNINILNYLSMFFLYDVKFFTFLFEPYKAMVEVPFPTIALYAFYTVALLGSYSADQVGKWLGFSIE